jgi:hypothetical protein
LPDCYNEENPVKEYYYVQRSKEKAGQEMKIAIFAASWAVLYFWPQYAGDWYDLNFNLYQGLAPLALIALAGLLMDRGWHRRAMFSVLIIQIVLNVIDSLMYLGHENYNGAQTVLNSLELMLILDYSLWGIVCAKRNRNDPDTDNRSGVGSQGLRG